MKTRRPARLLLLVLLRLLPAGGLALAGCATPPPDHLHTLGAAAAFHAPDHPARRILAVGPVSLPPLLRRQAWVVSGPANEVIVYEHQRWAQPLEAEVAQWLAATLDRPPLSTDGLWADPDAPAGMGEAGGAVPDTLRLRVQVLRLDSRLQPLPAVDDAFAWSLECSAGQAAGPRWHVLRSGVREAGGTVPGAGPQDDLAARFDGLARGHAQALDRLAADVAQALGETADEQARACPGAGQP